MILLDTNVLSAMMRAAGDPTVERWLDLQPTESIWTTTITIFEIRFGLSVMVQGRRRAMLETAFSRAIEDILDGRVLPFDGAAADTAATMAAERQRIGRPIEIRDVLIAGIVRASKATLATRNTRHFEGLGLALVDPWIS